MAHYENMRKSQLNFISKESIEKKRKSVNSRNDPFGGSRSSCYTAVDGYDPQKLLKSHSNTRLISIKNEHPAEFNPQKSLADWKKNTINPNLTMSSWKLTRNNSEKTIFQKRNFSRIMLRKSSKVDIYDFDKSLKNIRKLRFHDPSVHEVNKQKIKLS